MVTLGEFLDAAAVEVDVAEVAVVAGPPDRIGVLRELRRLVAVMARYLDDAMTGHAGPGQPLRSWELLAAQQRESLRQAERYLGMSGAAVPRSGVALPGDERVRGLARAVDVLSAGRELMRTHYEVAPHGGYVPRSRWARVLVSEPVVLAVAVEVSRWSDIAASWAQWVAAAHRQDVMARESLGSAQVWLSAAAKATGTTGSRTEAIAGRDLLRAVPLRATPERIPPCVDEVGEDLCTGIIASAERLRAEAFALPGAAPEPRLLSGPASRQTAQACAIAADLVGRAMQALAEQASALPAPGDPVTAGELSDAAAAFGGAREAWKTLTGLWQVITTDTQEAVSLVTIDVSDLVLRMGRLVFGDPRWTPAWRDPRPPDAARLAPDGARLRMVLTATHHAIDAVELVARADADGVRAAGQASRLYMPASILGYVDIGKRPYRTAPADRVFLLRAAYQSAADSSGQAARAMDKLAVQSDAVSRGLALLRTASTAGHADPALRVHPDVLAVALRACGRPAGGLRPLAEADEGAVLSAYLSNGLTIRECSLVFSTTQDKVSAILQANGIRPGADRGRDIGVTAVEASTGASAAARGRGRVARPRAEARRIIEPPGNRVPQAGRGQAPSP
jgi:hypothetical protein